MLKRCSRFAVCIIAISSLFTFAAQAGARQKHTKASSEATKKSVSEVKPEVKNDDDGEASLDLGLRKNAAAMPTITADGSVLATSASHMILVDVATGSVLAQKAEDAKMYPSSMTKIMTLYLIFERLKQGILALDSRFTVSEKAWRMQGSKMFVPLGGQIMLEDLIRGIAIQSGNDACVVVAEGIAGSEEAFAKQMNDTAKKLGMNNSNFTDASGWPSPDNTTTAHDLSVLATAIIRDFPEYYHYLSEREFTFHGIRQFNRNLLLADPSLRVDGLKTGHTEAAGYGITLSALDPATQRRLVLVVNGLDSDAARAQEGKHLLKWGLQNFRNATVFTPGQEIVKAPVWMGSAREVPLTVSANVNLTLPKTGAAGAKASVSYVSPLMAPVAKGQEIGKLTLMQVDGSTREFPLVAGTGAGRLGFLARIPRALGL